MIGKSSRALAARSVFVVFVALAFGLADMRQSFAGCGGYCEAQQARSMCHQAVKVQGLKAREREVEFETCKADPASYLELGELTDDADLSFE